MKGLVNLGAGDRQDRKVFGKFSPRKFLLQKHQAFECRAPENSWKFFAPTVIFTEGVKPAIIINAQENVRQYRQFKSKTTFSALIFFISLIRIYFGYVFTRFIKVSCIFVICYIFLTYS